MKRKLMIYILTILFFAIIVTTSLFIAIANFQYRENIEQQLLLNNQVNINVIKNGSLQDTSILFQDYYKSISMRLTYIDKDGNVINDSFADASTMENHNNRPEVIDAREKGTGIAIRYSTTFKKNMIYVASEFNNGYIMRSSIPFEFVSIFKGKYLGYYSITVIVVVLMAALIASQLSYVIIKPIKELETVTSCFAKGELGHRYNVLSNDEIGQLGRAFNNMALRLQSTLRDSLDKQNRLEAILKSMDSGVIAVDRNHKIIMINPYAKKIFGINKDIIGKYLIDYIRDFEFENVFKYSSDEYKEIRILWPSERVLRIKTADIINEGNHIGTVAVVQDITDLKKLENMRSEFVANVSHELKTPLTSIKGFAETLKYVDDDVNKEKFLNIINDEAERLTRLINDILTLSDIEMHREMKQENFNVSKVINDVYNLIKHTAEQKKINFSIDIKDAGTIVGDVDRFKQMLINLADNAIKYSEHGDKVVIGAAMSEDNCVVWVEDTGAGIPQDHIPRLFERFYRVDKARSRARGGTGLGLAIVKHIVYSFNGTIEVESEVGVGSKFIVKIPIERVV